MDKSTSILIGMATLAIAVLAFAAYAWWRRQRVHRVEARVKRYLCDRYGALPDRLNINCSDDSLWPVLVTFNAPLTGSRHSLQFTGTEKHSAFVLLSEREKKR